MKASEAAKNDRVPGLENDQGAIAERRSEPAAKNIPAMIAHGWDILFILLPGITGRYARRDNGLATRFRNNLRPRSIAG